MKQTFVICLLLLLISATEAFAQDGSRKHPTRYITERGIDRNLGYQYLDSNMSETEIFHAMYQKQVIFQDLGNIGSAGRSAMFAINRETGFAPAFSPYDNYFMKRETAKFYNTTIPYSELFYAQGANEMLFLKASHAQNILPRWSAGIDYQRITSEGFLLRQKTSHYNIQLGTRYQSKNKRYDLIAHATWNKGTVQENGGIGNDSAFEALTGNNRSVNVNLLYSQNMFKNRSLFIKQYYKFGSPVSLIKDEDTLYDFKSRAQVAYTIRTEEFTNIFTNTGDTLNFLLPNEYRAITPNNTYDSMYTGLLENKVNLQLFGDRSQQAYFHYLNLGIAHQAIIVSQPGFIRNLQNVIVDVQAEADNYQTGSWSYKVDAQYNLAGFNAGDYKANARLKHQFSAFSVEAGMLLQQYKPEYSLYRFSSNQFVWDNNLKATTVTGQQLNINTTRLRNNFQLNVNLYQVNNYAYLGNALTPVQANTSANIVQVRLAKTFQLGKFFFKHMALYQHSDADFIPVPALGGMLRYYFQTNLYSSKIQIGFDLFYNSSYYALGWSPASRMFYVQNQTKVGNYPLLDPFVCMQIKRAVLFAKYEHANQDLIREGYYNTPHYPISFTSFKIGIRWRMYN